MATTPPPSLLREPAAPRHGAGYDSYDPYQTRHSARVARQRLIEKQTTSPPPSPKKSARQKNGTLSPPETISAHKGTRGQATFISDSTVFDLSDLSDSAAPSRMRSRTAMVPPAGSTVLPTPKKTPRSKKTCSEFGPVARSLFPDTAASTSSAHPKKAQKFSGFSLDSFHEGSHGDHNSIEIFTDSRDRIPVINNDLENPFAKKVETKMTSSEETLASKRRKIASLASDVDLKESVKRDDGMLYTFRGKKVFRKFDEKDEEKEETDEENDLGLFANRPDLLDSAVDLHVPRLTRSTIKGRVLFPKNKKQHDEKPSVIADTDEEAATDIDEHIEVVENDEVAESTEDAADDLASKRSLRARPTRQTNGDKVVPAHAAVAETTKKGKRGSPFDIWVRKKQSPHAHSVPKKREAEGSPTTAVPAVKKTRGTPGTAQ